MECPKCGGARSVCKCLWFSKESLDKALYPEKTLRDKITSLQARVQELEAELKHKEELCEDHCQIEAITNRENARLRKALEGLTNAALAGIKPLPSQVEAGFEALRELDGSNSDHGERKCACEDGSGVSCPACLAKGYT